LSSRRGGETGSGWQSARIGAMRAFFAEARPAQDFTSYPSSHFCASPAGPPWATTGYSSEKRSGGDTRTLTGAEKERPGSALTEDFDKSSAVGKLPCTRVVGKASCASQLERPPPRCRAF
jgi:hypothetical protein